VEDCIVLSFLKIEDVRYTLCLGSLQSVPICLVSFVCSIKTSNKQAIQWYYTTKSEPSMFLTTVESVRTYLATLFEGTGIVDAEKS
jgi:hypothetical protein